MATQTPNLKLNLFEGSERPDKNLFNDNNQKIDAILKTASTHTHDGVNAAKITAKNVVFNNGETTLASTNLEDAVKEVFTEADNKITWITNAIGRTETGNLSDPDKRFDEINTDFIASRTKYRDDMSKVTKFIIETGMPDASASLNEIADAINNTVIDGITATKEDIITGVTAITKYGVVEQGSLSPLSNIAPYGPRKDVDITIPRGIFTNNITLTGFGAVNPERYIRKGIDIMGVVGELDERGSNGWDIGELIEKRKTTAINEKECFIKPLISNGDATFSLPYSLLLSNYENNRTVEAQHYMASANTSSQIDLVCYSSDLKRNINISIGTNNFMSFKKNLYTNQSLFYVGRYDDTSSKYMYCICIGNTSSSNTTGSEIVVYNITNKSRMFNISYSDVEILDIVYPEQNKTDFNNQVLLIGRKNNSYVYITINVNSSGKATIVYKDMPSINFVETNKSKSLYFIPNYVRGEVTGNVDYTCNCKLINNKAYLTNGDKLAFNNIHTMSPVTIKLQSVNTSDSYKVLDINGNTISSGTVAGAKDVIITTTNLPSNYFTVSTTSKLYVQDVLENGQSIMQDKIYDLKPLKTVYYSEQGNKPIYLWGQTIYDASINKSESILIVDSPINMYDGIEEEANHYYKLAINNFNLTDNSRINLNGSLTTNWGYGQDNILFSSYADTVESVTSATGAKWYRNHRDLIKLNYVSGLGNDFTITYSKLQTGISYKPFRPCFIDSNNRVMGIERSCTPDRFEYFCVLDSSMQGLYSYNKWSETSMRKLEEDLVILDEVKTLYGQGFITSMKYCYKEDGSKDNKKLIGCLYQRNIDDNVTTSDFIQKVDETIVKKLSGISAIFKTMYKINSTRY